MIKNGGGNFRIRMQLVWKAGQAFYSAMSSQFRNVLVITVPRIPFFSAAIA